MYVHMFYYFSIYWSDTSLVGSKCSLLLKEQETNARVTARVGKTDFLETKYVLCSAFHLDKMV